MMPRRRFGLCLATPLTLLTLLAACGGSGDGTGPNSAPVLSAASATNVTGQFGDAFPVGVMVKTASGAPVADVAIDDTGGRRAEVRRR